MNAKRISQLILGFTAILLAAPSHAQDRIVIRDRQVEEVKDVVRVVTQNPRVLEQQKIEDAKAQVQVSAAATRGFSVVLVVGDSQATTPMPDNIPAAARKALQDMKDFLPFKSYRFLDAGWNLGSNGTMELRGLDDQRYRFNLQTFSGGGQIAVNLYESTLGSRAAAADDARAVEAKLLALRKQMDRVKELQSKKLVSQDDAAHELAKLAEDDRKLQLDLEKQKAATLQVQYAAKPLVGANFSMEPGETVVVGTSRLQGDKALIVLLTAVPNAK